MPYVESKGVYHPPIAAILSNSKSGDSSCASCCGVTLADWALGRSVSTPTRHFPVVPGPKHDQAFRLPWNAHMSPSAPRNVGKAESCSLY